MTLGNLRELAVRRDHGNRDGVVHASEGGYRARLATVRVSRRRGRSLLLRAPLVTSWQDDPEFQDKVRLIGQWWRGYGQGSAAQPR